MRACPRQVGSIRHAKFTSRLLCTRNRPIGALPLTASPADVYVTSTTNRIEFCDERKMIKIGRAW